MIDTLTRKQRSMRMALVRGKGNKSTELMLVSLFRKHAVKGWRRGVPLLGKPDFVFKEAKVAVFVDGCFWHGCPRHKRVPKSRIDFWETKLNATSVRDRMVSRELRKSGWKVVRIWECGLSPSKARRSVRRILDALEGEGFRRR